ncbi:MAG: hypothetical protein SCABRO_03721 [Candidatus Scalindua brodae]|uniref:Uncharacterized protein n=1 Tax=Candidatus Scalindua brodae TaxID=237368 RepID=A0A0B0EHF9_9BACT|nr:MAG: hypothetical protein SCABRO_03721 [Candidatus Scalindua brodae]
MSVKSRQPHAFLTKRKKKRVVSYAFAKYRQAFQHPAPNSLSTVKN